jgi:hypothetical protein
MKQTGKQRRRHQLTYPRGERTFTNTVIRWDQVCAAIFGGMAASGSVSWPTPLAKCSRPKDGQKVIIKKLSGGTLALSGCAEMCELSELSELSAGAIPKVGQPKMSEFALAAKPGRSVVLQMAGPATGKTNPAGRVEWS